MKLPSRKNSPRSHQFSAQRTMLRRDPCLSAYLSHEMLVSPQFDAQKSRRNIRHRPPYTLNDGHRSPIRPQIFGIILNPSETCPTVEWKREADDAHHNAERCDDTEYAVRCLIISRVIFRACSENCEITGRQDKKPQKYVKQRDHPLGPRI